MNKIFLFCFIFFFSIQELSSKILPDSTFIESSTTTGSSKTITFLPTIHNFGLYSSHNFNSYIRAYTATQLDSSKFDWGYGLDFVNRYDYKNHLFLHQAYLQLKYSFLVLSGGLKEEYIGNQDYTLSSGGAVWSKNAPPMPMITLATNDYVNVPFTKGFVAFKAGLSHGWFDNNRFLTNTYLHRKYFYLKFGGSSWIHFNAGIQHYVQWGGTSSKYGKLPSDFKNFLKVFFAYNNEDVLDSINSGMPKNEAQNRIGNHLGTKDFGFDFQLKNNLLVKLYWQNFIEDITGLGFRNINDGIWGIVIKNRRIGFCYEYINTYTYYVTQKELGPALDNYFINSVYQSGWTFNDWTLGTPFITSPNINPTGHVINNNRVKVHFISLNYRYGEHGILGRFCQSKNYGSVDPFYDPPVKQYNGLFQYEKQNFLIKRMNVSLIYSFDRGNFFPKNEGVGVTLKYFL